MAQVKSVIYELKSKDILTYNEMITYNLKTTEKNVAFFLKIRSQKGGHLLKITIWNLQ